MHTLTVEHVRCDTLTPYPGNARRGNVPAVAESLQANGLYKPIVVQRSTRRVLAGNHTLAAALSLGWDTIAAVLLDVDDATARRINLVDNRSADLGTYDLDALAALLGDCPDLTGTGYTADDLARLAAPLPQGPGLPDDDDSDDELPAVDRYSVFTAEQVGEAAFEHFRTAGFPYRCPPAYDLMQQVNRLARTSDDALVNTTTAYAVADAFHPERYSVECWKSSGRQRFNTPVEAYASDRLLKRAIALALDDRGLTAQALANTLSLVSNTRAASNFRPGYALSLYRRFLPPGGTVLDTSAGFGGRLVGFLASQGALYIGIDPFTCPGNKALAYALGMSHRVELHPCPAEDVPVGEVEGRADFAFTSPPYFATEHYADDDAQSWKRYATGEEWRSGFLGPLMRLQAAALKDGATAVVNIAPVTLAGVTYPLDAWTVEAARAAGLVHVATERFPLGMLPGRGEPLQAERYEPVLLFRKP